jgi:hypothetical protein
MKYLFAFKDAEMCRSFRRALKSQGISCEIRNAQEFPDGTQGPELWVRDDEDYENAMRILDGLQSER